jgi:S-DNA-T family DNA segregation ATPase FtsK/SpoIIIE
VGPRGREALALLGCAAAVYLCLALASLRCDPADPTVVGGDWVGPVGASIAGLLARGFGVVAWLVPVELILVGAPLFRRNARAFTGMRLAGDLVVAIVLAALVHVAAPRGVSFGRLPVAGNVGFFFGEVMQALFSSVGSFLVGGTIVALILIGRSAFSFIECVDAAERLLGRMSVWLRHAAERARAAWEQARQVRKDRARTQEREAPHIEEHKSDEAILAHLEDDESDWIPIEQTGAPPMALSRALRESLERHTDVVDVTLGPETSTAPPPGVDVVSGSAPKMAGEPAETDDDSDEPDDDVEPAGEDEDEALPVADAEAGPPAEQASAECASRSSAATPKKRSSRQAQAGPVIVDTRPAQRTERGGTDRQIVGGFTLPSTELLDTPPPVVSHVDKDRTLELAAKLEKTLSDYGVTGKVVEIQPGPTVTTYEVVPAAGTKVSKIANLSDDLALGLSRKVRIIAPIPGKSRIGFEVPNDERVAVNLRELVEDRRFDTLATKAPLPVVLGRDIVGAPYYADLASMPHVIVAGATGAGKSVGLNVMLSSLLFRRSPDELRLLMIDPKVVELAPYEGIPHLLLPVVTDMKQAATALKWAVDEMERRYQLFANAGTKNITTYNRWVQRIVDGEIEPPKATEVTAIGADGAVVSVPPSKTGSDGELLPGKLPFIVIVVDEFADLMMQQGKEVEASVARLAQKARAAGMHVVLATQRPSVDVITGMIKANFPTRVAFRVAQKVDSRTILDEQGSELLLGRGDMLVKMNGSNETRRVQCPFISEEEVDALTDHLREQGAPQYNDAILLAADSSDDADEEEALDARFDEAVRIVADTQRCSTSWLQRKMTIGYNRAAKMVEMMERRGMVGPPNGAKDREVFMSPQ